MAVAITLCAAVVGCGSSGSSPVAGAGTATKQVTQSTVIPAARGPRAAIRSAETKARQTHRRVLIDFGAGWCPDCRALDVDFGVPMVARTLRASYVVVHIDVGDFNKNMDVSAQYENAAAVGIPALAVLMANGTIVTTTSNGSFANTRYMTPGQVRAFLQRWA